MTEDTTLLRADTGAPTTFRQLLDQGHDGVLVWSLDEQRRLVAAPMTKVFPSGVKAVYRLRLASGREVKATGNHPFLIFAGWAPLEKLAVGDHVAIPRRVPEPINSGLGWSEERLGLLAHLIGGGGVLRSQLLRYTSDDRAKVDFVERAAAAEFGVIARRVRHGASWHLYLCPHDRVHPLYLWLRELGIEDLCSREKRIPDQLHSASNVELAVFLRHLWGRAGKVVATGQTTTAHSVYYATPSRALADGVVLLLTRFGIIARTTVVHGAGLDRPVYHVVVADEPSLRAFCEVIGIYGRRGQLVDRQREPATDDVLWDRIVAIEALGELPVYDATVKGTHNFIADGVIAHNSLEQDSDVVILVHREDLYERESPRAGEADLIVAKHRNGPTATVTVAFQGHYSRFVDMAVS